MRLLAWVTVMVAVGAVDIAVAFNAWATTGQSTVSNLARRQTGFLSLARTMVRDSTRLGVSYANTGLKEEFGDAAWIARQGFIPMLFVVKDANEVCMVFDYLRLYRRIGAARTPLFGDEVDRTISFDQFYWFGGFAVSDFPGVGVGDTILFEWELRFRDCGNPFSWKINHYFNRVLIGEPLPTLANWRRADLHYHTRFSDNVFEFGGFMWMVRQAAEAIGLDAVCITDHSTDLNPTDWNELRAEADSLSDGTVLLIPGEEMTVDSDETNQFPDNRLHMTAYGLTRLLPAPEECCADNASGNLWTLRQALDSVTVQKGVAMAAHPTRSFNVGYGGAQTLWTTANFEVALTYPAFVGSEFFNERQTVFDNASVTEDFIYPYGWQANPNWETDYGWQEGMVQFLELVRTHLSPPRKIALAGGSDAHGDFAYKTHNQFGTIDMSANDVVLGKPHTLIYSPSGLTREGILQGIRDGAMVMSDGPAFTFSVDEDGDGVSEGTIGGSFDLTPSATLAMQGVSAAEFGSFTTGRILGVHPAGMDTVSVPVSGMNFLIEVPAFQFVSSTSWVAILAEVFTTSGYRCVTSPVYLSPQSTTGVGPIGQRLSLSALYPNPTVGSTMFTLTVQEAMETRVEIFDIEGRKYREHALGILQPGTYLYHWDGRDRDGRKVPAGLYFVRLITPEAVHQRKAVVVH